VIYISRIGNKIQKEKARILTFIISAHIYTNNNGNLYMAHLFHYGYGHIK